ncbi:hypothetical protein PG985_010419 [Apiospora marii]|uniref:Uncharacterized protein n=1 Tax=Apiospora marii TaxID=335849 RepID=A0ABR1RZN9_9PEZI
MKTGAILKSWHLAGLISYGRDLRIITLVELLALVLDLACQVLFAADPIDSVVERRCQLDMDTPQLRVEHAILARYILAPAADEPTHRLPAVERPRDDAPELALARHKPDQLLRKVVEALYILMCGIAALHLVSSRSIGWSSENWWMMWRDEGKSVKCR